MSHHCHANDCPTPTNPRLLMCPRHWRLVPEAMKAAVWSTFKLRGNFPGQNPDRWADYYEACADAVEHVAATEGKPERNAYRSGAARFRASAEKKLAHVGVELEGGGA